jgi:acyl dehydratase
MTTLTMADLESASELDLGASEWITITQEQVDLFADATGDHQWIHVDEARAAEGPFGGTIAHGYLTLSLVAALMPKVLEIEDSGMGVNYGLERVRFTSPVRVGSRVRMAATLVGSEPKAGGLLNRVRVQMEIDGDERPAMVGEALFLAFPAAG